MEQLVNLIINNGLGVASFGLLVYFFIYFLKSMKETMNNINSTLITIQENMEKLTERIEDIEKKGI